jgi:hypothetical protein
MSKKIKLVSVCKGFKEDSLLYKTFNDKEVEVLFIENNNKSLSSLYNKFINSDYKDYIVLFVHDDVFIADGFLKEKSLEAIKRYDVFGVAGGYGGLKIENEKPSLWHLISNKHAGFAGHYKDKLESSQNPFDSCWMTNFGPSPQQVLLIDGVFIGINVEKVLNKGLKFDEKCPSKFHFYDLLFSVNAKIKGLTVGVFPIILFHQSHGLTELTEEFAKGDQYFKRYCNNIK